MSEFVTACESQPLFWGVLSNNCYFYHKVTECNSLAVLLSFEVCKEKACWLKKSSNTEYAKWNMKTECLIFSAVGIMFSWVLMEKQTLSLEADGTADMSVAMSILLTVRVTDIIN